MVVASALILHDPSDAKVAGALAAAFRTRGYPKVLASASMQEGVNLPSQSEVVVAIWSKHAVENEAMVSTAGAALALGRLHSVRIDEKRIPAVFGTNSGFDLSDWDGSEDSPLLDGLFTEIGEFEAKSEPTNDPRLAVAPPPVAAADIPASEEPGADDTEAPESEGPVMRVRVRNQPRAADVEHAPIDQAIDRDTIIVGAPPSSAAEKSGRRRGLIAGGVLVGLAACVAATFVALRPVQQPQDQVAKTDAVPVESAESQSPSEIDVTEVEAPETEVETEFALNEEAPARPAPLRGRDNASAQPTPSQPSADVPPPLPARQMSLAERDSVAYAHALEADTIAAYNEYLNEFPEGFHAVDARSRREGRFAQMTDVQIAQLPRSTRTQVERARRTASRAHTAALSARLVDGAVSPRNPTERLVVVILPDGARYEGQWEHGEAFGVGRGFGGDGGVYAGSWQRSRRNGFGVLIYPSGVRYEGEFINDTPTGRGVFWDAQGRLMSDSSLFTALLRR